MKFQWCKTLFSQEKKIFLSTIPEKPLCLTNTTPRPFWLLHWKYRFRFYKYICKLINLELMMLLVRTLKESSCMLKVTHDPGRWTLAWMPFWTLDLDICLWSSQWCPSWPNSSSLYCLPSLLSSSFALPLFIRLHPGFLGKSLLYLKLPVWLLGSIILQTKYSHPRRRNLKTP